MTSKEEENFLRIVYLHYRVVTPCLTTFFDGIHPQLSTTVNLPANKSVLLQLYKPPPRKKRVLNDEQWNTLFPPAGFTPVTSAKLDLTLMVCLLRNISPVVNPPVKGFDKRPPDSELNHGAHLARIKYYKNYLVSHSKDGTITDSEFNLIWADLETAIKGLGNAQDVVNANLAKSKVLDSSITTLLSTGIQIDTKLSHIQEQLEILRCNQEEKYTCIYKRIEETEMKSQKMNDEGHRNYEQTNVRIEGLEKDFTDLKNYRILLSKQYLRLEESLKTEFKEYAESTCSEIQKYISSLETKAHNIIQLLEHDKTPTRCPEWMILKTQTWKKADEYFVETKASGYVLDCIRRDNCVSIVGPSGAGKTFVLQHVALEMEKNNGFTIICVNSPNDILQNYNKDRKTLFVMDDMCGNFTANTVRLDEWKRNMEDITLILEGTCKLIIACRLQVFQDEGFSHSDFKLFKKNICNLIEKQLALTDSEKEKLVKMYFKNSCTNPQLCLDTKRLYQYDFFPLLCKLYHTKKDQSNFCLKTFLKDPFVYYKEELDDLFVDCMEGKKKVFALLLLVIYNNHLEQNVPKEKVDDMEKVINDIREQCGINDCLTIKSLILELGTMTGTFVSNDEGFYNTIHDKLFDVLAYYFGTQNAITKTTFTEILITHADTNFIGERFELTNSGNLHKEESQYVITIQDDYLPLYIKRVFDDMIQSDDIDKYLKNNRNVFNKTFQINLRTFMIQLDKDKKKMLIQHASIEFVRDMFVMNVNDISATLTTYLDCFGVLLEHDQVQEYIQRIFYGMTISRYVTDYIKRCRCCSNESFHTELLTYMTNLKPTKIRDLIEKASTSFVQRMFVITTEYIRQDNSSVYKRYGIVIPWDLLDVYIKRTFDGISKCVLVDMDIRQNRNSQNRLFHNKLRAYMSQLDGLTIKTTLIIASQDCLDSICVFNDGIKGNNQLETKNYDVIFPQVNTKVYQHEEYDQIDKHHISEHSRLVFNFVDVRESLWDMERYGVTIPGDCIPLYVRRWFDKMKTSTDIEYYFNRNRNTGTKLFQKALLNLMAQLEEDEIKTLIQTATNDFLHKMFVMTQEDIKHDSDKMYQHYGIVLPEQYLKLYTDRILSFIKRPEFFIRDMNCNRNLKTILKCMSHLSISKIAELLDTAKDDFFHRMITVDVENKLPLGRKIADWPYHDYVLGNELRMAEGYIACPFSLIKTYMDRMISDWSRGNLEVLRYNINLKNKTFVEKYVGHLNNQEASKMLELLYVRHSEWKHSAERKYTALTVSCVNGDVDLAKWCLEKHLYATPCEQRYPLCAMFLLVVFNNHLEASILHDNSIKVNDIILLFRERHNILEAISAGSIKEKLDTCFNGMIFIKDGVFAVKHSAVFQFLVFYFTSIIDMTHILIENADGILLCEHFLVDKFNEKQFLIKLDAKHLHRCTERVFEEMTKSDSCVQYVIDRNKSFNAQLIFDYIRCVNKEEIKTKVNDFCSDFINNILCISDGETERNKDIETEPNIVVPDASISVYINSFFNQITKSDCVASCFEENKNKKTKRFHDRLSVFMKGITRDKIEMLIQHASSDFICRMLVISEETITLQSYREYERYGILVPEDCFQMYIERVFNDFTECDCVYVNRNSGNRIFRDLLHSHASLICGDVISTLIQTGSSTFIRHMNLSTEGNTTDDINSHRNENYFLFILPKYYKIFKQQWPKGKKTKEIDKTVYISNAIEDDFGYFTLVSRRVGDYKRVRITVNKYNKPIINDEQCRATRYIDPILTSHRIEYCVITPENVVDKYMQRMTADWMKGKVHDVFANINLKCHSFLCKFLTHLRSIGNATQRKLAKTPDTITGDPPLTVCCYVGISQLVEWCLDNFGCSDDLGEQYEREFSLYIACRQNDPDVVLILLKHENGPGVNTMSKVYEYKQMYDIKSSLHNQIRLQLFEVERRGGCWAFEIFEAPLFIACKYGHTEIVSILLSHKAHEIDINQNRVMSEFMKPADTMTPLFIACKGGHADIVSLLLNHGVDVNKLTRELETPLFAACENGHKDIVSLLLKKCDQGLNICRFDGTSPLFAACREGHVEVVLTLLNYKGIDIYRCMHTGMSPLFIASFLGHTKIVEILVSRNASPYQFVYSQINLKRYFAQFSGCIPCFEKGILTVKTFIKYIRQVISYNGSESLKSYMDKMDNSWVFNLISSAFPLNIACLMGHTEIVELLVDHSLNIKGFSQAYYSSALFPACELGHEDIVRVLLSKNAHPTLKREDGKTPVLIAIQNGHMKITLLILNHTFSNFGHWISSEQNILENCLLVHSILFQK